MDESFMNQIYQGMAFHSSLPASHPSIMEGCWNDLVSPMSSNVGTPSPTEGQLPATPSPSDGGRVRVPNRIDLRVRKADPSGFETRRERSPEGSRARRGVGSKMSRTHVSSDAQGHVVVPTRFFWRYGGKQVRDIPFDRIRIGSEGTV